MKPYTEFRYMENGLNSLTGVRHTHDNSSEILQIIKGSGSMIIGNRMYPIRDHALFLVPPMEFHRAIPDSGVYVRNILNLSDRYLETVTALTETQAQLPELFEKQCLLPDEGLTLALSGLFRELHECSEKREENGYRQLSVISGILHLLSHEELPSAAESNDCISAAVSYINENLSRKMTLDEICEAVHLSRYYFCRRFREKTGMRPFDYIAERRISVAKKELTETDLPCSAIAENTGFGSFSSFSSAFTEKTGMTPTQFRAANMGRHKDR